MIVVEDEARSIFLSALDREPGQWPAYLDEACAGNAELRARVDELLDSHQALGSIYAGRGHATAIHQPTIAECPGMDIGPYKLVQQIGEGGFGVVFLAEQSSPVKRRVALKIIKPGMDTREVIARFEVERQALAMMDHPCIAKVYDAGATENGRPYFVMELVQGVPITEYCDQCNLTTKERLELFVTVCQAVQHAHQKGVIHRDIKPTNVLVAIQDGRPAPKIIDFGVAKAINQQLTDRTLMTAYAQIIGTPLYMSPEQAELSPLGVDTRSDIYSLGVLLYELLAGTTPFDKDRLHAASYDELLRIIREEEPPRPSARISTLAADLATTLAEHRRTDVRRLQQTVRGELDWIAMKCLEKERNRRYDSVGSLASDIERYLHDEPVLACPPSTLYRLRKYARRNKVALAFGTLLVAGCTYLAYSNAAIKREREAKTAALSQATTPEDRVRLAEILTNQSRTIIGAEDAKRLAMDAAARTEEAHRHIRQAIEAYDRVAIDYPDDFDRRLEAIVGFVQVLKVCLGTPGFAGEVDELNRRLETELPKLLAAFPDSSDCQWQTAMRYLDWAYALANRNYPSLEEHAYSKQIEILEKIALSNLKRPVLWLFLADAHVNLGDLYWQSARPEAAESAFLRAKEIYAEHAAEIAAEKHTQAYGITAHNVRLAYFLACTGREDQAAEFVRKAAETARQVTKPAQLIEALCSVAGVHLQLDDAAAYRETCKVMADVPVADADDLTKLRTITIWCCAPDAFEDMSLVVKRAEELVANNSLGQHHDVLLALGQALYRAGQYDRAEDELTASIEAYPANPAPGFNVINFQRLWLAMTKWQLGKHDEARRLLAEALPDVDKELQSPATWWNYRLGLQLLRREAEALIKPTEVDEAVKNKSQINYE
jgi:serine/threonine protein kinase